MSKLLTSSTREGLLVIRCITGYEWTFDLCTREWVKSSPHQEEPVAWVRQCAQSWCPPIDWGDIVP